MKLPDASRTPEAPALPDPRPVEVRTCPVCHGDGYRELSLDDMGNSRITECGACRGRGRIATNGGEP